ncbi:hypothetical protein [Mucilaginibacter sp. PAMB04168]|uniref:hypothetical protein n=1 Tax=Mucilaginibacter sp. PAMB04168 TaxID=3138567 RepID=UPI0031F6CDCA
MDVYLALYGYDNKYPVHKPTITDVVLLVVISVALNTLLAVVLQNWLDNEREESAMQ